jgi:pimeloyl-ACP methyl ester carboxylesterase
VTKAIFLPGAGGRRGFWQPVASRLDPAIEPVMLAWPGFGDEPRDDAITSLEGLVEYVLARIDGPSDLIAQSMGGVIALSIAARHPALVRRLVLTGTSGGIDVSRFGAADWRAEAIGTEVNGAEHAPRWFVDDRTDLTGDIPNISAPALLIWGAEDRISPPAVGEHLASLLPNAQLEVVPGEHDHPLALPEATAAIIEAFLLSPVAAEAKAR